MNHDTIDGQLLDLMLRAGSRWVLWVLLALSLGAITVIFERIWFFLQERAPRELIRAALKELADKGPREAIGKLANAPSMEVAVARACLVHAADGPASVEEHKAAMLESERLRYEKRLAFLGTLGNNAPFVGLFGTVLGIVTAFRELGTAQMGAMGNVMSGIAEALIATAVGILVALPAVIFYNVFQKKGADVEEGAYALGNVVIASMKAGVKPNGTSGKKHSSIEASSNVVEMEA